ncbi:MAG: M81 family metallopeptidase [Planctomycetota bacterium]|nr:M81 family metallopeptidase [Planctomycetota bacterium]
MMRIALGEIVQETGSFTPSRMGRAAFEAYGLYQGTELVEKLSGVGPPGGFLQVAQAQEEPVEVVPLARAWAGAGAKIQDETAAELLEMLLQPLREAGQLDAVFLSLHGAASSERDDDLEGAILAAVRDVIGPDVPLACPLDHHANITARMMDCADLLVGHETQPHDPLATGVKTAKLLFDWLRTGCRPATGWRKIPMITPQDQFLTSGGPMKEWFDRARVLEQQPGVLDVSPYPMQPWLDVAEGGWAVVVHTENDPVLADQLAAEMGSLAWELREAFWRSERVEVAEAVRRAYAHQEGLLVLSDTGDSVYGGAPGDSTWILRELLRQVTDQSESDRTMLVPIVDRAAVDMALAAGVGAEITVSLGGKIDHQFNQPVPVTATVVAVSESHQADIGERGCVEVGGVALLQVGPVHIAVMASAGFAICHPVLYQHLGLEIEQARAVVVKTASNFQFFAPWRRELIRVDSPGMTQSDLAAFTWTRTPRPIYPFDANVTWNADSGGSS